MKKIEQELISALLSLLFSEEIISKAVYSHSQSLVYSSTNLPQLFSYPNKEGDVNAGAKNSCPNASR